MMKHLLIFLGLFLLACSGAKKEEIAIVLHPNPAVAGEPVAVIPPNDCDKSCEVFIDEKSAAIQWYQRVTPPATLADVRKGLTLDPRVTPVIHAPACPQENCRFLVRLAMKDKTSKDMALDVSSGSAAVNPAPDTPQPPSQDGDGEGEHGGETTACPIDLKLCPDGNFVERIPPSCDFAPCAAAGEEREGEGEDEREGEGEDEGEGGEAPPVAAEGNDVDVIDEEEPPEEEADENQPPADTDHGWQDAVRLTNDSQEGAFSTNLDTTSDGHVVLVWKKFIRADFSKLYYGRIAANEDRLSHVAVIQNNETGIINPVIKINDNGDGIVIWEQGQNVPNRQLVGKLIDNFAPTGSILQISTQASALGGDAGVDRNGNIFVVWSQMVGDTYRALAKRYNARTGNWSVAIRLISNFDGMGLSPRIVVTPRGNALVTWSQHNGFNANIVANFYYVDSSRWVEKNTRSENREFGDIDAGIRDAYPRKNLLSAGTQMYLSLFRQKDETNTYRIGYNRYDILRGYWLDPRLITASHVELGEFDFDFTTDGNGMIVYHLGEGGRNNIYARHYYQDNRQFGDRIEIDRTNLRAELPVIDMDDSGNAMVVWKQRSNNNNADREIAARFYSPDVGWSPVETLAAGDGNATPHYRVTFTDTGKALVIWQHKTADLHHQIWMRRYSKTLP